MIISKIIIDINSKVFILKGECMNRHYVECKLNNIRINDILTKINNLSFFNNKYYKKPSEVYNNNHCNECKKIYYNINTFNICQKHNKENNFFCEDCIYNICDDCKNEYVHKFHNTKSYLDLIPNKNKKKQYQSKIEENKSLINKKIEKINKIFGKIKEDINELKTYEGYNDCNDEFYKRYKNLKNYLKFLLSINNLFLNNFDFSYPNIYHLENFYYFYDYINKELTYNIERYKHYIIFGNFEKNFLHLSKNIDISKNEIKQNNKIVHNEPFPILSYTQLVYFRENIFLILTKGNINFLEFKDFSFHLIFTYEIKETDFDVYIQIGEYNNTFFLKYDYGGVYFFEYNIIEKKINLKKYIDVNRSKFFDIIDQKNGDIIMTYRDFNHHAGKVVAWKNSEEHIIIDEILNSDKYYCNLLNLNDDVFIFKGDDYITAKKIYCFNSKNFEFIKSINCEINYWFSIEKIGKINDRFFFVTDYKRTFKLIDIKYLEIVQCIENFSFHFNIKNYFLLEIKDNSYIKKYFNLKEGKFINEEIMKKIDINLEERDGIICPVNNEFIIILKKEELTLIKI